MKANTLKLCLLIVAMTAQQSVASLVIPPFLDDLKYPVSAIGSLISLAPVFALAARLPSGMTYRPNRTRTLLAVTLVIVALCDFLYSFAVSPFAFGLVHALNGFAFGAATTIHLAFFVEALPAGENRHHAMGYYAGSLATGYSTGGFAAGYIADRFGYAATFQVAALLSLLAVGLLFFFPNPRTLKSSQELAGAKAKLSIRQSFRSILDPRMATVVVVSVFLNILHQMGNAFLPLYGLAVGLSLTDVGIIKGVYSLANAITRPLSGLVSKRLNKKWLMLASLPLQSVFMMVVPLFHDLAPLLAAFVLIGFLRAVAIVGNTIQMVESAEETRIDRGIASGVFNAAGDVGNILGPSAGGLIASFAGVTLLFLFGPILVVCFFFFSVWSCSYLARR